MAGNPYVVDMAPMHNMLARWGQQQQQQRQMEQQADQFQQTNMLARDQFGELQKQHGVTNQLARDQFGLAQNKNEFETGPLAEAYRRAQIEHQQASTYQARQHGEYYRAAGAAKSARPGPQPVIGMREDGSQYIMDAGDGTVDVNGGSGDDLLAGPGRFGARGLTARDVPGVVTNGKGASDRFATERARGQDAIETHPDVQRLQRFTQNQELWTRAHGGRPRAGHMYDEQGREVAKGPMSNSADTADRKDRGIESARAQIVEAEKALLDGWFPGVGRAVAGGMKEMGTPGRFINNMTGLEPKAEALDKMKHGVLQTVYALSGKQTTNKEMDHFLDLYLPRGGESADLLKSKSMRLQKMLGTLQSATRRGMVYEDAERAAIAAASDTGASGNAPPPNPAGDRLKNKYGLE